MPTLLVTLLCLGAATLLLCFTAAAYADPPTTTARDLPGWQRSAFTITLDCDAGTTSGDELYATRQRMDWEADFSEKLWSDNVIGGTLWVLYSFVHYDGSHLCYFYSIGHNNNTNAYEEEATKTMTVKIDTSSPTFTVSPKPTGWVNTGQSLSFTATDPNMPDASGLKSFNLTVDGATSTWTYAEGTSAATKTWDVLAPVDHSNDGLHSFEYWAGDWAGNEASHGSFSFGIDTVAPSGSFALAGGAAKTTVTTVSGDSSVSDAHGPLQMRFSLNDKATWSLWASYAAPASLTLPAGLGTKTVYAQYRDAAGNVLELPDAIELVASAGPTPTPTPSAKPVLGTPVCPASVRHGTTFKVYGALRPHFAAGAKTVKVKAYRYARGKWTLYQTYAAVNADYGTSTRYRAKPAITRTGNYRFRAFTAATAQRAAAKSGFSRTLTVK